MTIWPPHSENVLPESAAHDVEIHKRGAASALVVEHLDAADTCQMSAHFAARLPAGLARIGLAFAFSFPSVLRECSFPSPAFWGSRTATCFQAPPAALARETVLV